LPSSPLSGINWFSNPDVDLIWVDALLSIYSLIISVWAGENEHPDCGLHSRQGPFKPSLKLVWLW
jgi:hypothetical protein